MVRIEFLVHKRYKTEVIRWANVERLYIKNAGKSNNTTIA
jgi:hypothetical protein